MQFVTSLYFLTKAEKLREKKTNIQLFRCVLHCQWFQFISRWWKNQLAAS